MTTAPRRVRVTGPHANAGRRRTRSVGAEIDAQTQLGEVYMRSLVRTQLRLAARVLGLLTVTVGALPAVFVLLPATRTAHLFGVPLAWLLLGLGVYPLLVLLGWRYVREAERNEQAFSDLVERR